MNTHGVGDITEKNVETTANKKKKEMTDADLQKKSVKLVVMHLKKKVDPDAAGIDRVLAWLGEMEDLLEKDGFDRVVYMNMRKQLYEAIEWVFDVDLRHKLRNSWYSYGKAMDKKVPRN
ncbi:MAG: hypothetical protein E7387_06750 [Ruminococcaceae bacterium]|nr:hypothetical protein [Oscillospiraceae bacterium]